MNAPIRDIQSDRNGAVEWRPGKLWSLWDIMREFDAAMFLGLVSALETLGERDEGSVKIIPEETKQLMRNQFPDYEKGCVNLDLDASLVSVRKLLDQATQPNATWDHIVGTCKELKGRLIDQMSERAFFGLSLSEKELFDNPKKGWEVAIGRFPQISDDIEEASKCYALSRYAAAVFHSVQAVEAGLLELGMFLKVSDPRSGWTAVSKGLNTVISKSHKSRSRFEKKHFAFLEQLQGTVEALKNAWRNKISHAHGRLTLMTTNFSPDVAQEILLATRAFMRRLAEGIPATSAKP